MKAITKVALVTCLLGYSNAFVLKLETTRTSSISSTEVLSDPTAFGANLSNVDYGALAKVDYRPVPKVRLSRVQSQVKHTLTISFPDIDPSETIVTSALSTSSSSSSSSSELVNDSLVKNLEGNNLQFEDSIPEKAVCLESLRMKTFSKAVPYLIRPPLLTGKMAGDAGFDPLKLSKTTEDLVRNREAELKHGRLAMLAAVGWPLSELLDNKIAGLFNMSPALDAGNRAPSLLNHFQGTNIIFWVAIIALGACIDVYGIKKSESDVDYFSGNLGFDPLGFYPNTAKEQKNMQVAEIKHGRTAMMAVLVYTIEEMLTNSSIVKPL